MSLPAKPKLSAIIVTLNEAANLRHTVECFQATLPAHHEIVVVDDGSSDGSTDFLHDARSQVQLVRSPGLGVAKARNWGACHSSGDILVFADAHVTPGPDWWLPMIELLTNPSVGGVGPVISDMNDPDRKGYGQRLSGADLSVEWLGWQEHSPHTVPLLPGAFLAMRRDTFEAAQGFDDGMICWGSEDSELSLRLWLLGYELWLVPQVEIAHLFQEYHSYTVEWRWVLGNKLRLAFLHFGNLRIARVVEALREHQHFAAALALAIEGDFSTRRAALAERRRYDDAWYFHQFGPHLSAPAMDSD